MDPAALNQDEKEKITIDRAKIEEKRELFYQTEQQPPGKETLSDKEIFESGVLQDHLGFSAEFLIQINETWNEERTNLRTAILQRLRKSVSKLDFKETILTETVLKVIGFKSDTASRLSEILGEEIQDPTNFWEKLQEIVELQLGALVACLPDWSRNEQAFKVYNNREGKKKQYRSILVPSPNELNGNAESLRLLTAEDLDQKPPATETWYHATNFKVAEEILKNGFDFLRCLKNRNFSHGDGIYFSNSVEAAKELFIRNANELAVTFDVVRPSEDQHQNKMVVLAFFFENLLEKYKDNSIDLRDPGSKERLKKIVHFFSHDPLTTQFPTEEENGLGPNYKKEIEYIIGPHSNFPPKAKKNIDNIYTNDAITQLCVRCVGTDQLKLDLEEKLNEEIFVVSVDDDEIEELSK